jgi:hypothetical protein
MVKHLPVFLLWSGVRVIFTLAMADDAPTTFVLRVLKPGGRALAYEAHLADDPELLRLFQRFYDAAPCNCPAGVEFSEAWGYLMSAVIVSLEQNYRDEMLFRPHARVPQQVKSLVRRDKLPPGCFVYVPVTPPDPATGWRRWVPFTKEDILTLLRALRPVKDRRSPAELASPRFLALAVQGHR